MKLTLSKAIAIEPLSFMNSTTYLMSICKFTSSSQLDTYPHIQSIIPSLMFIHDMISPLLNSDGKRSDSMVYINFKSSSNPIKNDIAVNFEVLRRSIDESKVTRLSIHSRSKYLPTIPTSLLLVGNSLHTLQVDGYSLRFIKKKHHILTMKRYLVINSIQPVAKNTISEEEQ